MTATPHKGDPENFCRFLELLDRDVYGNVQSLEEAMRRNQAPFYLRRVKEALVTFPHPDTGKVQTLFTRRLVKTVEFELSEEEFDFYDALTRYVEDQSIRAAQETTARGRAVGFTMAMLQRRFASSVYAVRRSLERMKQKREKILANPEAYRQEQIERRLPEDFDELPDEEQQEILEELEGAVASVDPAALAVEIGQLGRLIGQALELERREVETKLVKLREALGQGGRVRGPEDEAIDLYGAQGHAGLPGTQAAGGMEADGNADSWRYEDWGPGYAREPDLRGAGVPGRMPGTGRDRSGGGGD
jgi:hypothetical protein